MTISLWTQGVENGDLNENSLYGIIGSSIIERSEHFRLGVATFEKACYLRGLLLFRNSSDTQWFTVSFCCLLTLVYNTQLCLQHNVCLHVAMIVINGLNP